MGHVCSKSKIFHIDVQTGNLEQRMLSHRYVVFQNEYVLRLTQNHQALTLIIVV